MTFGPFCPVCDSTPYDPVEDTCSNPTCSKHWSRLIDNPKAAEAERQAAIYNQSRRTR